MQVKVISAQDLSTTKVNAPAFLVEGVIPQGLILVCGRNKTGKSRLILQLAVSVALGEPLLGCIPTTPCAVLYYCPGNSLAQIQARLNQLTDTPPANLYICASCEKLQGGLEEQIAQILQEHPDVGLVVIDPFQAVRKDAGKYSSDFDDVAVLKRLADKANVSLLLVENLRKNQNKRDPYNEVYGVSGIVDAADTVLRLEREHRYSDEALLSVTGRDVTYQVLLLRLEDGVWQLVSRDAEPEETDTPAFLYRLIAFMDGRTHWEGTATELLEAMGETTVPANYVTRYIKTYAKTVLEPEGILFYTARTSKARKLVLDRRETHEPTPYLGRTA